MLALKRREKCTYNEGHELLKIDFWVLTLRDQLVSHCKTPFPEKEHLNSQKRTQRLLDNQSLYLKTRIKPLKMFIHDELLCMQHE